MKTHVLFRCSGSVEFKKGKRKVRKFVPYEKNIKKKKKAADNCSEIIC